MQIQLWNQSPNRRPNAACSQEDYQKICHDGVLEVEMISGQQRNRRRNTRDASNYASRRIDKYKKVPVPNPRRCWIQIVTQSCLETCLVTTGTSDTRQASKVAIHRPSNPSEACRVRVNQDCRKIGEHQTRSKPDADGNEHEKWAVAKVPNLVQMVNSAAASTRHFA